MVFKFRDFAYGVSGRGCRVSGCHGSRALGTGFRLGFRCSVFSRLGVSGTRFVYGVFEVGFQVRGFGYGVTDSWFRDLGFLQVCGFEYGVSGTWFLIRGFAIRGLGYGVTGSWFRDSGFHGSWFWLRGSMVRGFGRFVVFGVRVFGLGVFEVRVRGFAYGVSDTWIRDSWFRVGGFTVRGFWLFIQNF